jgi:mannosyltransferase
MNLRLPPQHIALWQRWLLLTLILLAFGRVTWRLGAQNFWWDESLSLQRAEQGWWPLIRGELVLKDGFSGLMTIDQHPFFSFLLQGVLIRLAGTSEYVVRFPAAAAATLLVPALWVLGRRLVKQGAVPPGTPDWVALLGAVNPFYLWYGQEGRPYALWALLAGLSTYLLLRMLAHKPLRLVEVAGYGVTLVAFLATHYLGVFLVPLHGLIIFAYLARHNLRRALLGLAGLGLVGAGAAAVALWQLIRPGAGDNLNRITLGVLVPDLLNAFSMGLSVDINDVWWLDLFFGLLAVLGVVWGLRSWQRIEQGGWILPLFVLIPVVILLVINIIRPAYMNARHMSLISGGFLLLVATGLGALGRWRPWLAGLAAVPLVVGAGYSTVNYFTLPQYGKDHYAELGQYLHEHLLPGDVLLLNPPSSWRIFRYYLPLDLLDQAIAEGEQVVYYGVPLLNRSWEETFAQLDNSRGGFRRIWHANSGTHPYFDLENQVEGWLNKNAIEFRSERFFSPNSIVALELYLPDAPVDEGPLADLPIQYRTDVAFGEQIHLVGYDVGEPLGPGFARPVNLYWRVTSKPEHRYKYILRLVEVQPDGSQQLVAVTEREPYGGVAATLYWDPGKTIIEYSEFDPGTDGLELNSGRYQLTLQMYHAETLEKLPGTVLAADAQLLDEETVLLPLTTR